jgi:hypothetical protein
MPVTYRLSKDAVMVPPGVVDATVEQGSFVAAFAAKGCEASADGPIAIQVRGKRARVTVRRDELLKEPGDWLSEWAAGLEARGCIAPGTWWKLANQVAESVPMDVRVAFRLIYGEAVDIGPQIRIQVDSPVMRSEAAGELTTGPMSVKEAPNGLQVELRSTDSLLGYERAWYSTKAKAAGNGVRIVPMSAERHVNGATEQRPQPAKNYFSFPVEAGYYRLVYKQEQTEFTALVVAGRTRAELDERAKRLAAGGTTCGSIESGYCLAIPKGVGVNLFLPVTVNGQEVLVHWGTTLREAIRYPGNRAEAAIPTLEVSKLHNGKAVVVEFDRSGIAILGLRLTGGETISWK